MILFSLVYFMHTAFSHVHIFNFWLQKLICNNMNWFCLSELALFDVLLRKSDCCCLQKQGQIADVNNQLSELDSKYRALEHSSEIHRNKVWGWLTADQ